MESFNRLVEGAKDLAQAAPLALALTAAAAGTAEAGLGGYEGVDPSHSVKILEVRGTGLLNYQINETGRIVSELIGPDQRATTDVQCPVQKGDWRFEILNKGGYVDAKTGDVAGSVKLEKSGDDGVWQVTVVAPNQFNHHSHIEGACILTSGDNNNADTERVQIFVATPKSKEHMARAVLTRPQAAFPKGGFNVSDEDTDFLGEGNRVGLNVLTIAEKDRKDGVDFSLGLDAYGQHAFEGTPLHAGLRLAAWMMPEDIDDQGTARLIYRPQVGVFAEIGYHSPAGAIDVNAGPGYIYAPSKTVHGNRLDAVGNGSGDIPNGTVLEANAGYSFGTGDTKFRLGAMGWADGHEDAKTGAALTLGVNFN